MQRQPFASDQQGDYSSSPSPSPSRELDDDEEPGFPASPSLSAAIRDYPGQDKRSTSRKEIYGWYSYAWAAEVFPVCGMGSFIPVLLEQLAREHGHLSTGRNIPCGRSEAIAPSNTTNPGGKPGEKPQCVVDILGWSVNTASFVMYTFSFSVLLQSLVIISMSGAADHGRYRKQMLLIFAYIGAISCLLFLFVGPDTFFLASLYAQIGNVAFGASFVLLNAFLPVMVRYHDEVAKAQVQLVDGNLEEEAEALLSEESNGQPRTTTTASIKVKEATSAQLRISTRISSFGIAIGYFSAVLLQIFCIFMIKSTGATTHSLQLAVFVVGIWWCIFTVPSAILLRPRPGPPLPGLDGEKRSFMSYITYSWKQLWMTVTRARQLQDVMLFLGAWFMISDGVATIASSAMMFAKTELHMPAASLALIGIIMPVTGMIGAFSWPKISPAFGLSPGQTIIVLVVSFALIPAYGLLGLIPGVSEAGFGLTRPGEMYGLATIYGFVLGGLGGYCRSVFGELIPPGSEAAFYALYAITDKGSSIFGPTIVGLITDRWGDIRLAFGFILVLLLLPIPILWFVDISRGKARAVSLAAASRVGGAYRT